MAQGVYHASGLGGPWYGSDAVIDSVSIISRPNDIARAADMTKSEIHLVVFDAMHVSMLALSPVLVVSYGFLSKFVIKGLMSLRIFCTQHS